MGHGHSAAALSSGGAALMNEYSQYRCTSRTFGSRWNVRKPCASSRAKSGAMRSMSVVPSRRWSSTRSWPPGLKESMRALRALHDEDVRMQSRLKRFSEELEAVKKEVRRVRLHASQKGRKERAQKGREEERRNEPPDRSERKREKARARYA